MIAPELTLAQVEANEDNRSKRKGAVILYSGFPTGCRTQTPEIVGHFLSATEAVVAHWVEYSKALLRFRMVPGDARSGECSIYDRQKGTFWLLSLAWLRSLASSVFGGYSVADMRQKIRDFRLLDLAEDPSRLRAAKGKAQLVLRFRESGVGQSYATTPRPSPKVDHFCSDRDHVENTRCRVARHGERRLITPAQISRNPALNGGQLSVSRGG